MGFSLPSSSFMGNSIRKLCPIWFSIKLWMHANRPLKVTKILLPFVHTQVGEVVWELTQQSWDTLLSHWLHTFWLRLQIVWSGHRFSVRKFIVCMCDYFWQGGGWYMFIFPAHVCKFSNTENDGCHLVDSDSKGFHCQLQQELGLLFTHPEWGNTSHQPQISALRNERQKMAYIW